MEIDKGLILVKFLVFKLKVVFWCFFIVCFKLLLVIIDIFDWLLIISVSFSLLLLMVCIILINELFWEMIGRLFEIILFLILLSNCFFKFLLGWKCVKCFGWNFFFFIKVIVKVFFIISVVVVDDVGVSWSL